MTIGDFTAYHDLASCWRGDWSDFDGRSLRAQLEDAEQVARGQMSLERFRLMCGICPTSGKHWSRYCGDLRCDQ